MSACSSNGPNGDHLEGAALRVEDLAGDWLPRGAGSATPCVLRSLLRTTKLKGCALLCQVIDPVELDDRDVMHLASHTGPSKTKRVVAELTATALVALRSTAQRMNCTCPDKPRKAFIRFGPIRSCMRSVSLGSQMTRYSSITCATFEGSTQPAAAHVPN